MTYEIETKEFRAIIDHKKADKECIFVWDPQDKEFIVRKGQNYTYKRELSSRKRGWEVEFFIGDNQAMS